MSKNIYYNNFGRTHSLRDNRVRPVKNASHKKIKSVKKNMFFNSTHEQHKRNFRKNKIKITLKKISKSQPLVRGADLSIGHGGCTEEGKPSGISVEGKTALVPIRQGSSIARVKASVMFSFF